MSIVSQIVIVRDGNEFAARYAGNLIGGEWVTALPSKTIPAQVDRLVRILNQLAESKGIAYAQDWAYRASRSAIMMASMLDA